MSLTTLWGHSHAEFKSLKHVQLPTIQPLKCSYYCNSQLHANNLSHCSHHWQHISSFIWLRWCVRVWLTYCFHLVLKQLCRTSVLCWWLAHRSRLHISTNVSHCWSLLVERRERHWDEALESIHKITSFWLSLKILHKEHSPAALNKWNRLSPSLDRQLRQMGMV